MPKYDFLPIFDVFLGQFPPNFELSQNSFLLLIVSYSHSTILDKGWNFNLHRLHFEEIEYFRRYNDFKIAQLGDSTFINKKFV